MGARNRTESRRLPDLQPPAETAVIPSGKHPTMRTTTTTRMFGLAAGLMLSGCSMFQFHGTITTTKTVDGQTTTTTQEFDDWEEMKVAMDAAAKELRGTTKELLTKLVEAPPPGEVHLADLAPTLADYEGNSNLDFVGNARASGDVGFTYVQIGVPTYDAFFKSAAEFHGFVYQTRESIKQLRVTAKAALGRDYDEKMSLGDAVHAAVSVGGEAGLAVEGQLTETRELAMALAGTAPNFAEKTQGLVSSGQQLIAGAPSSITNPKTVLHLDLIVKGLGQSVRVVEDSGKLLVELARDLATLNR